MKLFNEVKDNSGSLLWHKHRRGTEKSKEGGRVAADISLLWGTASGLKKYQAYLSSAPLHRMVFNSSKVPDNICLESPCWSPWWSAHLHPTRSGGFWDRWVGHTTVWDCCLASSCRYWHPHLASLHDLVSESRQPGFSSSPLTMQGDSGKELCKWLWNKHVIVLDCGHPNCAMIWNLIASVWNSVSFYHQIPISSMSSLWLSNSAFSYLFIVQILQIHIIGTSGICLSEMI